MDSELINRAKNFAIKAHADVNHYYDDMPYDFHLEMAVQFGMKYISIIPSNCAANVISAIWLHDTIEDCRKSYNDIKHNFNYNIAELVYAVTNEKGKTRWERASNKYYAGIRAVKFATFVKLADRLANVCYSKNQKENPHMFKTYRDENLHFVSKLLKNQEDRKLYSIMVNELNDYFNE